ncbi:MAG: methyltransferase domain-containing protein [Planctomycetota bacterium]
MTNDSTLPANEDAWRGAVYQAWLARFGAPPAAAAELRVRARARLAGLDAYFGELQGRRVLNLMGSNGMKAVATALLGAQVTVVDFAQGNADYAQALAEAAGVELRYIVSDVLALDSAERARRYDLVFAELGILHYFSDLAPFAALVTEVLERGARFVLRDFHPVSTKLLSFRGSTAKVRKVKVTGDYFEAALRAEPVSFAKYLPPDAAATATVLWRRWTLGEVVTAFAAAGLRIERLVEEPNRSSEVFDRGIPKTFVLVAVKA